MIEKGGTVSAKMCALQLIFCVQDTKYKQKSKIQEPLHELEGPRYQKSRIKVSLALMTFSCQRSKQHQGGLNGTRQADSLGISVYTNLKKLLLLGREKKKYPARQCKVCAAHKKQSETRNICKLCVLLYKVSCFEKYHSLMNY
jgi:hypothetical protein